VARIPFGLSIVVRLGDDVSREQITDFEPEAPTARPVRRFVAPLFLVAGLGLVPWTIFLAVTLPARHLQTQYYDLAWGGFDVALAALLVATGVGLARKRLWVQSTATAAATLLVCDAWFDVLSSNGRERIVAIAMAALVELPSAVVCLLVARHVEEIAERFAVAAGRLRRRTRQKSSGVANEPELDLVDVSR
jgi:hypothetical protein